MTMHSHSNGQDLPEPPFQFCLAGPYSAAAALETHPFRTPPPPPPAAKTKSASSGYQRPPPRDSRSFEFRLAGPSSAAASAAAETLPLRTPPPPPAAKTKSVSSAYQKLPPQRMPPRLGWRALVFGLVRVPAEMELHDIRKRQRRRQRWNSAEESAVPPRPECRGVGHGPWKLIRSLSCRGFESTAVIASAAPLSFI
ncbi:formin-like protein 14 [Ananas comosus]|uniref:Formin-like protein 14 n=1 Tax=Ananas comosus TaxID=4615 RepID=A0A6P5G3I4_ANACO|nr:formin-like protein 14 [Ananas comosus]